MFRLLEHWGVRPDFVAGSLDRRARCRACGWGAVHGGRVQLVAARGRLMQALPTRGAMVAVQASEADVLPLLEGRGGDQDRRDQRAGALWSAVPRPWCGRSRRLESPRGVGPGGSGELCVPLATHGAMLAEYRTIAEG